MNTTPSPAIEAVERLLQAAIDAGPNMEPWDLRLSAQHLGSAELVLPNQGWFLEIMDGTIKDDEQQAQFVRDAAFIATASPANISRLLALLAAKQEELDKMRADLFPLQEFMDSIFGEFPDHGDIDGFDLQDIAEACGLLKKEATVTPCGEHCGCAENGIADGTETQCYRVQPVMRRARIAVAKARAALSPTQGNPK